MEKVIFFQAASGYRNNASGDVNNVGSNGNYWSVGSYAAGYAYFLNFSSSYIYPQNGSYRANGFSVRPAREL